MAEKLMIKINLDFYRTKYSDLAISDIDRVIRGYIEVLQNWEYDKVIEYDPRDEVFWHLSLFRTSTISWYTFKKGASVIEVAGGFGAVSKTLCEKAEWVAVTESSFFELKLLLKDARTIRIWNYM